MNNKNKVLAIDIGGTNIKTAIIDRSFNIIKEDKFKTPTDYKNLLNSIIELTQNNHDLSAVSIALPGSYNHITDSIFAPNLNILNNRSIKSDLSNLLDIEICIENDGNLATLGEYHIIEKASIPNMVFLTLGTGVGGGVIINGELLSSYVTAFEIGHILSVENGRQCGCGRLGCLDEYASSVGLNLTYNQLAGETSNLSPLEISKLVDTGNSIAKETFRVYATHLARAVTDISNIFAPDKIKLGGGLSELATYFIDDLLSLVKKDIFPSLRDKVLIEVASLKNQAGMLGAAVYYFNKHK